MKKVIFLLILSIFANNSKGKDLIHLNNGKTIKGHIIELKQDEVTLSKSRKNTEDVQTFISNEVKLIELDASNMDIIRLINDELTQQQNMCNEGFRDATLYHRRFVGNFALGFFFNIIGFTIVAISNPKAPDPLMINDIQKMNSTEYLLCYEKKARKKNITAAGIGLGAIVFLFLGAR
jgi:hypothetical protein